MEKSDEEARRAAAEAALRRYLQDLPPPAGPFPRDEQGNPILPEHDEEGNPVEPLEPAPKPGPYRRDAPPGKIYRGPYRRDAPSSEPEPLRSPKKRRK